MEYLVFALVCIFVSALIGFVSFAYVAIFNPDWIPTSEDEDRYK